MAINNITANELREMIDQDNKLVVVDVRTSGEVARGKIPGSINIPLDSFDQVASKISDKNAKIIVYCLSGSRSKIAAELFRDNGYKNVFNLENGLLGWRMNNFELV